MGIYLKKCCLPKLPPYFAITKAKSNGNAFFGLHSDSFSSFLSYLKWQNPIIFFINLLDFFFALHISLIVHRELKFNMYKCIFHIYMYTVGCLLDRHHQDWW